MYETNLLEFISKEENNLLTSIHTYHDDITMFARIDDQFQAPTGHVLVPATDNYGRTLLMLYLFTQYHLYFSFTTILRCHLADSFASTRKAIDATLTAYRLYLEPNTLQEYLDGLNKYKFIKQTVAGARAKDSSAYPLAPSLLELHDLCSQYGSHADISSFVHRMGETQIDEDRAVVEHFMFQYPDNPDEFRYYIVSTLLAFLLMHKVFVDPIAQYLKDFEVEAWRESSKKLIASVDRVRDALASQGLKEKTDPQE